MNFQIFSVYDAKAESYGTPMFLAAKGQAIRSFQDQANTAESMICKYPGDFTLFLIGSFDSDTGKITPINPQSLGTGVEYKTE